MYHNSANVAFGRREKKHLGVQKVPRRQEAYKKNRKKSCDLFFIFLETVKNLWGRQKMSRGHQMVTLRHWARPIHGTPGNIATVRGV